MSDTAEKLQKWVAQELNIVSEGRLQKIPSTEVLRCLTTGKNRRIWTYVFDHVYSESKVLKIKRSLLLKRKLEDDETVMPYLLDEKINALRQAIAKAKEKQTHLKDSIANIQDRIIGIEHDTQVIKQETLKYNQKSAFLNLLEHKYKEKNESLRIILKNIAALARSNKLFQKPNLLSDFEETTKKSPEFDLDKIFVMLNNCDEVKISSIITQDENFEVSLQNFNNVLAENAVFLPDLIVTLKKVCNSSLDSAINLSLQNDLLSSEMKKFHSKDDLIHQFQYDYVSNRLQMKKTSQMLPQVLEEKEKIENNLSDKLTHCQYAHAVPLLQILAENDMYARSNIFLEECLKKQKSEANNILKKNSLQKQKIKELQYLQNEYFKHYNVIVWLIKVCEKTFKYILSEGEILSNFAKQDVFTKVPVLKDCILEFRQLMEQERKTMWKYCDKNNVIKMNFFGKTEISTSSKDFPMCFGILSFQNIDKVYEKWFQLKVKLNKSDCEKDMFIDVYQPDSLKMFSVFLEDLQKMKQALNRASSNVDQSFSTLDKFQNLFFDWWEQNAQFIPDVKYDGKPLKVWIDVLSVLPDF